jgi:hypothetical protein
VNPSLAKENPHKEHEEHKRLLVSTAFHKRSIGYGREIFCLARWLAEVHKDPAPVLVNSRLSAISNEAGRCKGVFASLSYLLEPFLFFLAHTHALAQKSPVASAVLRLEPCSPYSLSPVLLIASVLPTKHLFDHRGP